MIDDLGPALEHLPAAAAVTAMLLLAVGCAAVPSGETREEDEERGNGAARRLARQTMIVDTHIDVPWRLRAQIDDGEQPADVAGAVPGMDFDYPRAREGGLDLPFMSIYIPASFQEGGAKQLADELIEMMQGVASASPERFRIVVSPDEAERAFADGVIGLALGMENGAPLEGQLANLHHFHDRGIRYITLTHSRDNAICDSSYDEARTWGGLSPFGREVVREMNRLGTIVDISHVSDDAFYQVLALSRAPVVASHSSCRHFTPGFERNMSDDMIRALAQAGGVIQINFGSSFISEEFRAWGAARRRETRAFAEQRGLDRDDEAVQAFVDAYVADNPPPFADLKDVADHIDRVVELVGVEHVGIGSDYDGVGDSLPSGLKDVSSYPNLIGELLDRGYSEEDVTKICSGNLMRIWRQVERVAAQLVDH